MQNFEICTGSFLQFSYFRCIIEKEKFGGLMFCIFADIIKYIVVVLLLPVLFLLIILVYHKEHL